MTSKHCTKVITTSCQYYSVCWKLFVAHLQYNIAQFVHLAQVVHGSENGLGMTVSENMTVLHISNRRPEKSR